MRCDAGCRATRAMRRMAAAEVVDFAGRRLQKIHPIETATRAEPGRVTEPVPVTVTEPVRRTRTL